MDPKTKFVGCSQIKSSRNSCEVNPTGVCRATSAQKLITTLKKLTPKNIYCKYLHANDSSKM